MIAPNCAFCNRANFEKRIVAEYAEWYVVATLGQITDGGYLLIIPQKHIPCLGLLPLHGEGLGVSSFIEIVSKVCSALSLNYCKARQTSRPILMFEHGIVGQTVPHAHLHVLPIVLNIEKRIRADFPDAEIEKLEFFEVLQEQYKKRNEPYLLWTMPDQSPMVCWNPPAPPQYLRTIVAEMLGRPERGNWRDMDPELDEKLIQETIDLLKLHLV